MARGSGARLVIVSTRPRALCQANRFEALGGDPRSQAILDSALWIDARDDELTRYFQWP